MYRGTVMIRLRRRLLVLILLSEALLLVYLSACRDSSTLPETLVPGKAVTRALWKDGVILFFQGKVGEVVTIHATSQTPGLDPNLALLDPEQKEEAFDDDSGGQGNSLIKDHALKKSGRYTVRINAAHEDGDKVEVLLTKRTS
jgi:hypothetical protein